MITISTWKKQLENGSLDAEFRKLLVIPENQSIPDGVKTRFLSVLHEYQKLFDADENTEVSFFSAPGRTELIGNHTDHQNGKVIAAAVNLDIWACAAPTEKFEIRFISAGWDEIVLDLNDLNPSEKEHGTTLALLKGVAACFSKKGYEPKGLNIYCQSNVLPGSGLSSSAACEVLLAVIMNHFWADDKESAITWAKIGQIAENQFFGKPSGLMDQMASAVGAAVFIDFFDKENPVIEKLDLNLQAENYALCIIDTGADHADLTHEYAAIPYEMKAVSAFFDSEVLSQVEESDVIGNVAMIRQEVGDRALLRAIHYYSENERVEVAKMAIEAKDFSGFLKKIDESGISSWQYLQNVTVKGAEKHQEMAVAQAIAKLSLAGQGAVRVHGGGFAGTIQAFVPVEILSAFKADVEKVLGENACHIVQIRSVGGYVFPY